MVAERKLTHSERAAIRKLVVGLCANYNRQDKECLPLDGPCYMLGKCWTGALCRYFRNAVLPMDPILDAALSGNIHLLNQKKCPVCGKGYVPVTSQAYCSDACRVQARREYERERKRRERKKKQDMSAT